MQVGRGGRKRRPCGKGADRGSNLAPTRKGADFLQVSHGEKAEQTSNPGDVYKGEPEVPSDPCPSGMARGGPCAELSLRSDDRALSGACVRLERRAAKVARCVLRGLRHEVA